MSIARRGMTLTLGWALAMAVVVGCGGPTYVVQQYDGDIRSRDTIAVVRINGNDSVMLDALDGSDVAVQLAEDAKLFVEVLPGMHTLDVVNETVLGPPGRASFRAEAGKFYRPIFASPAKGRGGDRLAVRVYEVDADSDALIRDVTLTARAPAPDEEPAPAAAPPAAAPPAEAPPPAEPSAADAGSDGAPP